jgi:hypothetical protein
MRSPHLANQFVWSGYITVTSYPFPSCAQLHIQLLGPALILRGRGTAHAVSAARWAAPLAADRISI